MKISLILLAAGDSRRFGSNKLLYELHGKPMYRYSVDEVAKLDTTVFAEKIVVSQYDEILDTLSKEGYLTVRNTESYLGISHSIQLGLAASEEEAWCFLVADQPYLKAETLERFVEAFQTSGKLLELAGDIGGKRVINKHLDETFFYDVGDRKELEDIDVNNRVYGNGVGNIYLK